MSLFQGDAAELLDYYAEIFAKLCFRVTHGVAARPDRTTMTV